MSKEIYVLLRWEKSSGGSGLMAVEISHTIGEQEGSCEDSTTCVSEWDMPGLCGE